MIPCYSAHGYWPNVDPFFNVTQAGCDNKPDMAVSWLDAWLDEQRSTIEWVCECGPPIVLILKIPLEQAFFSVPATHTHTFIVLQ